MDFENIITEKKGAVGVLTFNRPHALNAFCAALMDEVTAALDGFENDDAVRVIVVTGGEKAFAAGADIKEMAEKNFPEVYKEDFITRNWESVARCRKPVIAAVAGYCLGGGNELAMMCDFILAADTAKFSQPEITIGTLPGAGGTQRLTRLAGKSKAMELCLTGRMMDAVEAERAGLVARVFPAAELMAETMKIAEKIASFSPLAAMMVKESVNRAYETTLAEGLRFERRLFHASFATEDRKEGMEAFVGKRKALFKGR
ncbi:MAG: enoyl-CoA hydratase [Alphaproteobacteria bacterium]|nr:enoyl-CoA hydratase [Alphaproteobacteria bacterium]